MYKWNTSKHSKVKNVTGLLLWKRFSCNAFKTLSKSRGAGLSVTRILFDGISSEPYESNRGVKQFLL